jgi:UDP-N-acetyl-D-mannosaminuronate dehydrogenase
VLVLGLAYKRNNSEARKTPASGTVQGLADLGADVMVHDNHVGPHELDVVAERVLMTRDVVERSDAVVLVTDHDDVDYDVVTQYAAYVFDTRNRLRGDCVELL